MRRYDSLIDAIDLAYQAALEPGLWSDALAAAAESFEASRALILYSPSGGDSSSAIFSSKVDEPLADRYFTGFRAINPLQEALDSRRSAGRPRAYSDRDMVAKDDLVRTEFYAGFMRPADMHGIVMLALAESPGATMNIFRSHRAEDFERGEIELAARMQRSLSGAWRMGLRLGGQRALDEALADFIDRLPGAVLLVAADGRVRHANDAARTFIAANDGVSAPGGVLEAAALPARQKLRSLIGLAAIDDDSQRAGGAMSIPRPSGKRSYAVQVAPARGAAALLTSPSPLALVCISDLETQVRPAGERLRALFGLTAAESRVALALLDGSSLRDAADAGGVSVVTVRNQLARIYEKTGVNRQSALIGLITQALFPPLG